MDSGSIILKDKKFDVLLAISDIEQMRGLMYVNHPAPNMAFVYGQPRINKFWMKDTKIPLDIVFCADNKVVSICKGVPYSTALVGEDKFSDLVIEFPEGTCVAHDIKIGDAIQAEFPEKALMKVLMTRSGIHI
jgi:uncharacterized membrane protein (UPF0127 family)